MAGSAHLHSTAQRLLQPQQGHPERNPDLSHWKVLVSSRDQGLEAFRAWFPTSLYADSGIGDVVVRAFSDEVMRAIARTSCPLPVPAPQNWGARMMNPGAKCRLGRQIAVRRMVKKVDSSAAGGVVGSTTLPVRAFVVAASAKGNVRKAERRWPSACLACFSDGRSGTDGESMPTHQSRVAGSEP